MYGRNEGRVVRNYNNRQWLKREVRSKGSKNNDDVKASKAVKVKLKLEQKQKQKGMRVFCSGITPDGLAYVAVTKSFATRSRPCASFVWRRRRLTQQP